MAFDLSAFFGGFAEGAATQVEKKNKEIRDSTNAEMERLYRTAEKNKESAQTKREELKSIASELTTYRGLNDAGFTDQQIMGLLQSGAAKTVLTELRSKKDNLGSVDFNSLVKVATEPTDRKIEDVIAEMTTLPKGEPLPADTDRTTRTAFGLRTNIAAETEDRFGKIAGMSPQDLRAAAGGLKETGITKDVSLDLSQFKDPDTVARVQAQLRDRIAGGDTDLNSEKNKPLMAKLRANAIIEGAMGGGEEGKPRTASQISSVFTASLRAGMDPYIINKQARVDPETGDIVPTGVDDAAIKGFMDHKNKIIEGQARAMGLIDKDNNIRGGRNAMDALLPYAEIEDGKIKNWRTATIKASPAPGQEGSAAPANAPAAAAPLSDKPLAIPKTPDGKIDGTKLRAGQSYISDGAVQIWNGMNWQPVN
jgi:hypothetical protein